MSTARHPLRALQAAKRTTLLITGVAATHSPDLAQAGRDRRGAR